MPSTLPSAAVENQAIGDREGIELLPDGAT